MKKVLFACVLLLCPVMVLAQDADDGLSALYYTEDFVRDSIGSAWDAQDPAQLVKVAGWYKEAVERGNFEIEELSVDQVLEMALQLARDKSDVQSIDAIGKLASSALAGKVITSKRLAGESRNLGVPMLVDLFSTSPGKMEFLSTVVTSVDRARVSGNKKELREILELLGSDQVKAVLAEKEVQLLTEYAKNSEAMTPATTDEERNITDALDKLAGYSRIGQNEAEILRAILEALGGGGSGGGSGGGGGGSGSNSAPPPPPPPPPQNSGPSIVEVEVERGLWGNWNPTQWIPAGHRIVGFRVRFEPSRGSGDDTALNGIEILYRHKSLQGPIYRQMVHRGEWGDWRGDKVIPEGYEVVGMKTRFEPSRGSGDDTALNGIQAQCLNRQTGQSWDMMVEEGLWGGWQPNFTTIRSSGQNVSINNYYLAGIAVRSEPPQGSGDDTAMNGIRLIYKKRD